MRTFHLIAALALVVGKTKANAYDPLCGGDLTWDDDGPGFGATTCGDIGAYADSLGALADSACGNPALSGASAEPDVDDDEQTNIWLMIDGGGCCGVSSRRRRRRRRCCWSPPKA